MSEPEPTPHDSMPQHGDVPNIPSGPPPPVAAPGDVGSAGWGASDPNAPASQAPAIAPLSELATPAILPAAQRSDGASEPDIDLFGHAPRGRPDWSHRRGEPRLFALLWTIFLTVVTTTTLMRAVIGGRLDLAAYREGLRMTLMVIATAIALAWPLLRLSQARPRGPGVSSAFKDVLIILVPLQAVIWPQAILAHWPIIVITTLDAIMAAWALMVGAVVAIALGPSSQDPQGLPDAEISRREAPRGRIGAMAAIVALGSLGGAAAFTLDAALRPTHAGLDTGSWWMMLSPHTAVHEVTRDRAELGVSARVEPAHLLALAAQGALALLLWGAAAIRQALAPRPPRPPVHHPDHPAPRPAPSVPPPPNETAVTPRAELQAAPLAPDTPAR